MQRTKKVALNKAIFILILFFSLLHTHIHIHKTIKYSAPLTTQLGASLQNIYGTANTTCKLQHKETAPFTCIMGSAINLDILDIYDALDMWLNLVESIVNQHLP